MLYIRKIIFATFTLVFINFSMWSVPVLALTSNQDKAASDSADFFINNLQNAEGVTCGDASSSIPSIRACCTNPGAQSVSDEIKETVPDKFCISLRDVTEFFTGTGAVGSALGSLPGPVGDFVDTVNPFNHVPEGPKKCFTDVGKDISKSSLSNNQKVNKLQALSEDVELIPCVSGEPRGTGNSCTCVPSVSSSRILCDTYVKNGAEGVACRQCAADNGVWTGMGCLQTNLSGFIIKNVMTTGITLAGVVSLLCVMYCAYILQFSGGNPERIKKAREHLISCITGLILILFSVFILRLIGIDILRVPGFGG